MAANERKFLMWCAEYGEGEEDAVRRVSADWEGPREMATRWAEWHDFSGAEYDIAGKGKTVRVTVKNLGSDEVTHWDVTGEAVPSYSARPVTANC